MLALFFSVNLIVELLRLRPQTLPYAGAVLCMIAILLVVGSRRLSRLSPALLMGLSTPLMCLIDPQLLWAIFTLGLLMLALRAPQALKSDWALPFLYIILCWVVAKASIGMDIAELLTVLSPSSGDPYQAISRVYLWISVSPPDWIITYQAFNHLFVFVTLISLFSSSHDARRAFGTGLGYSLPIALLVTLSQIIWRDLPIFINQNDYWTALGRVCGTLSDPNAFGVFSFLLIGVLLSDHAETRPARRMVSLLTTSIWITAAFYSGSRSLVLGLVLLCIWVTLRYSPRVFATLCLLGIGLIIGINFVPQIAALTANMPSALQRSFEALQIANISEQLFSRVVFFKAGFQIWREHFLIGAGFNSFRELYPLYALKLQLGTDLWSDNANNYYLGVLSETGALGFLALCASAARFRLNSERRSDFGLVVLIVFALLLAVGPHLEFAEVAIMAAWLIGTYFQPLPPERVGVIWLAPAAALAALILLTYHFNEHGAYRLERAADGRLVHWLHRRAVLDIRCEQGRATFELAVLQPELVKNDPICVSLKSGESSSSDCFQVAGWKRFQFECPKRSLAEPEAGSVSELSVSIESSRAWIPADYGYGADRRPLGVMIFRE